jgi:hypothetical protein
VASRARNLLRSPVPLMPHPSQRVAGSYRVNFSPEAWKLIGLMPSTTFQSLQKALEQIAASPRLPAPATHSPLRATLDDLTVVYALNDTERSLTVLDILRTDSA